MVVLSDAAFNTGFESAGQRRMAVSALAVHGASGDQLVTKIREEIATLRIDSTNTWMAVAARNFTTQGGCARCQTPKLLLEVTL